MVCRGINPGIRSQTVKEGARQTPKLTPASLIQPPPSSAYLAIFAGGKKFAITQISIFGIPESKAIRFPSG